MTFLLKKTQGSEGKANARVGDKISFNLTVSVPVTSTSLKVEVYTEQNNSAFLSLCSPLVTVVGQNIQGVDKDAFVAKRTSEASDGKVGKIV